MKLASNENIIMFQKHVVFTLYCGQIDLASTFLIFVHVQYGPNPTCLNFCGFVTQPPVHLFHNRSKGSQLVQNKSAANYKPKFQDVVDLL